MRGSIGAVYAQFGDFGQALDGYWKALLVLGRQGTFAELGKLHSRIAEALDSLGDTQRALYHFSQAFDFRKKAGDEKGEGISLLGRGLAYYKLGMLAEARRDDEKALEIFHRQGNRAEEAAAWLHLGTLYLHLGQEDRAYECLKEALSLTSSQAVDFQAQVLYRLALIERNRGNALHALSLTEEALRQAESVGAAAVRNDLKALYLATQQDVYDFLLSLYEELGRGERAGLELSERARSRGLLERLSTTSIPMAGPELLAKKQVLDDELVRLDQEVLRLEEEGLPTGGVARERRSVLEDIKVLDETIRQSSPWVADLSSTRPLTVEEIQGKLLDGDSTLLEYYIGPKRSLLWVVTQSSVKMFRLPGKEALEAEISRATELFENSHLPGSRGKLQRQLRVLSQRLLAPARHLLGTSRLVIVPHGPLLSVPFSALPDPAGELLSDGWSEPLIMRHEIVVLPSLGVLKALRAHKPKRQPAEDLIAVLAEPSLRETQSGSSPRFSPLRYSLRERLAIQGLAKDLEVLVAVGVEASKSRLTSGELSKSRYLHFATHWWVDSSIPELSGLALAEVDADGRQVDSLLQAHEVSNLRLSADLVVLSACRTASGRSVPGEGQVGLAQAFFHAGAQGVIQSLWDVNDKATAMLMEGFYRHLFGAKLSPAAALQQAQIEMFRSPEWRPPGFWAGFFLQGDWR